MELTDRKKQILKIVVESYINTAEPVGSKAIVEQMPGKISSATIRNELADLVEMGYLEQPHTSAGRVPSAKGYRLYVNELMERKALSPEETAKINDALSGQMKQVDQVISQAGQMVSSFVGYPTYAVADHRTVATVQRFELISVSESSFIAVVMLSDNRVKSQLMQLDLPVDAETLPHLSHLLNTHFVGAAPEQMNATLMSLSDQVSGQWFLLLNRVTEYACTLLEETQHQQVFTNGASQLLKFPEFRDIDKAHDLMSFMVDNKEDLPVPQSDAPMQILIGPENVNDALKESSVVIASYDIGDNMRGLVGVVGPTRMDYAAVAARLSYFAESLSRMFGKKQLPEDIQGAKRISRRKRPPKKRRHRRRQNRLRRPPRRRCRRRRSPSPSPRWSRWSSWPRCWPMPTTNTSVWRRNTTTIASAPPAKRKMCTVRPKPTPSSRFWRCWTIWSGACSSLRRVTATGRGWR